MLTLFFLNFALKVEFSNVFEDFIPKKEYKDFQFLRENFKLTPRYVFFYVESKSNDSVLSLDSLKDTKRHLSRSINIFKLLFCFYFIIYLI